TAATLGAVTLRDCLKRQRGDLKGLPMRFQRALAKSNATPWLMSTGSDFRVPGVEGKQPPRSSRLTHRYFDGVLNLMTSDAAIYLAFIEVAHLLKSPKTLFRPTIAAKVLRHLWRNRKG
ncbi:MAG TPA: hypothetical protein VKB76_20895, partial [Ktedonobacterales bacterium]|nr:hypothetical protein [Ktedonobacterales bacterium]